MGSITNSITNTPVTTAGGSSSTFKGSSSYSSDFQNIIDRSVAIATLPINLLTNQQNALTSQSKELTTLDTKFAAMQTAIQKIGSALGGSSFQTEVSADKVVNLNVTDGAREGVYSMRVTSIGAYESSMSTANWDVPEVKDGTPSTFTLVVGNKNYKVTGVDNSPQAIVNAINANYASVVQATTVNVGPGDTRISLKGLALGQTSLDLLQLPDSPIPTSLQTQAPTGYAVSQTSESWDASGGTPATYTLTIGGTQHTFTPTTNNNADNVAAAINAQYGTLVRASVVNLGSASSPNNRIYLQSTTTGAMVLDLKRAGGDSLQTQQVAATSRSDTWSNVTDAVGSRSTYNLVVGTTKYSFTPADNSAASVASAINSLYSDQVQASVVDFGSGDNHNYHISLQSKTGSSSALDIQRITAGHFQAEQTPGALASYQVNNSGVTNTSTTRNIALSDGVTATLLTTTGGTPTNSIDITVTRSTSALSAALSGFADAFNATVDEVDTQRGQSAGPLGGQSVVSQLGMILSGISTYSNSGQFSALEELGLKLELNGHLTYNPLTLMAADLAGSAGVTTFLGSAKGGGFLKSVTDSLNKVEATGTGLLKTTQTDVKTQITNVTNTIATKQNQVDLLQMRLQNQMAVSDALIAAMEQQSSYFSNMFAAQQTANQMYK